VRPKPKKLFLSLQFIVRDQFQNGFWLSFASSVAQSCGRVATSGFAIFSATYFNIAVKLVCNA